MGKMVTSRSNMAMAGDSSFPLETVVGWLAAGREMGAARLVCRKWDLAVRSSPLDESTLPTLAVHWANTFRALVVLTRPLSPTTGSRNERAAVFRGELVRCNQMLRESVARRYEKSRPLLADIDKQIDALDGAVIHPQVEAALSQVEQVSAHDLRDLIALESAPPFVCDAVVPILVVACGPKVLDKICDRQDAVLGDLESLEDAEEESKKVAQLKWQAFREAARWPKFLRMLLSAHETWMVSAQKAKDTSEALARVVDPLKGERLKRKALRAEWPLVDLLLTASLRIAEVIPLLAPRHELVKGRKVIEAERETADSNIKLASQCLRMVT